MFYFYYKIFCTPSLSYFYVTSLDVGGCSRRRVRSSFSHFLDFKTRGLCSILIHSIVMGLNAVGVWRIVPHYI